MKVSYSILYKKKDSGYSRVKTYILRATYSIGKTFETRFTGNFK